VGCAIIGHRFDGYRACLHLIGSPGEASIPGILRILLESFADLRALAADPTYVRRMLMQASQKRHRVVAGMLAAYKDNAEHKGTVERAERELAAIAKVIADLKDEGVSGGLTVAERFKLGDLSLEQGFIYGDLSAHTHADFASIMARHLGKEKLQLGAPLSDQSFVKALVLPTFILLDSLLLMSKLAMFDETKMTQLRERGVSLHHELRAMTV